MLRWKPGVYSRVKTGVALQDFCLFSDVGLMFSCVGHLKILLEAWQGYRDASRSEVEDPGFLSRCHMDIGIPINIPKESGIVPF